MWIKFIKKKDGKEIEASSCPSDHPPHVASRFATISMRKKNWI
jgi:hypothetical protein